LKKRRRKPMFVLDFAVPRDIEPAAGELEDVYLYTVDDLQGVIQDNIRSRQQAALVADDMINQRIDDYQAWLDSRRAVDTISAVRLRAEQDKAQVLERAQRMLAAGQTPEVVMEYVANTLTKKLVHGPTRALRRARGTEQKTLLQTVRQLFDIKDQDT
jgi:glutamyl-tRNA reductase